MSTQYNHIVEQHKNRQFREAKRWDIQELGSVITLHNCVRSFDSEKVEDAEAFGCKYQCGD
jgi:hypothetical protein